MTSNSSLHTSMTRLALLHSTTHMMAAAAKLSLSEDHQLLSSHSIQDNHPIATMQVAGILWQDPSPWAAPATKACDASGTAERKGCKSFDTPINTAGRLLLSGTASPMPGQLMQSSLRPQRSRVSSNCTCTCSHKQSNTRCTPTGCKMYTCIKQHGALHTQ